MRRRDFLGVIGAAAAAWPPATRAQQPALPVIGFLFTQSTGAYPKVIEAFRQGLSDGGFTEGNNIVVEYRGAENQYDRLPALAADLVSRRPAVIVAAGGSEAALATKKLDAKIPVVFIAADGDPVQNGLVASFNHPGGNITGVIPMINALGPKRLELLHEMLPAAKVICFLSNPVHAGAEDQVQEMEEAGRTLGVQILNLSAGTVEEVDAAFVKLIRERAEGLVLAGDIFLIGRREQIVALAERDSVPAIYPSSVFAAAGGLMSYDPDVLASYRQAGDYAARILKGERPADLPVVRSTKFQFAINTKTAKSLGLAVPSGLLAIADEVIE
jgi:putative tryptophan/tyrosine transport system substrate-binding protein